MMMPPPLRNKQFSLLCWFFLLLLIASIPGALLLGTVSVDPTQAIQIVLQHIFPDLSLLDSSLLSLSPQEKIPAGINNIIWELRIPRILMACITGAGLAIAGLTLQSITRNTLADPHLLGISSGAVLGAVIVTMHVGEVIGELTLPIAAFGGSLLATLIIAAVSQNSRVSSAPHLLMCGVALSFVLMSAANFALFLGDNRASHQIVFWMLGGLGLARWSHLFIPFIACLSGYIFLHFQARYINALLIGDETAISLGINVKKLRLLLFITSALITAVLVANTGAIGFIGLMIPHICRYFVGGDLRRLLPLSALLGGLFLLWVDVLARTVFSPEELPIGIITGFIGGLFFIGLLLKQSR